MKYWRAAFLFFGVILSIANFSFAEVRDKDERSLRVEIGGSGGYIHSTQTIDSEMGLVMNHDIGGAIGGGEMGIKWLTSKKRLRIGARISINGGTLDHPLQGSECVNCDYLPNHSLCEGSGGVQCDRDYETKTALIISMVGTMDILFWKWLWLDLHGGPTYWTDCGYLPCVGFSAGGGLGFSILNRFPVSPYIRLTCSAVWIFDKPGIHPLAAAGVRF